MVIQVIQNLPVALNFTQCIGSWNRYGIGISDEVKPCDSAVDFSSSDPSAILETFFHDCQSFMFGGIRGNLCCLCRLRI